jgi:hypothetical protein
VSSLLASAGNTVVVPPASTALSPQNLNALHRSGGSVESGKAANRSEKDIWKVTSSGLGERLASPSHSDHSDSLLESIDRDEAFDNALFDSEMDVPLSELHTPLRVSKTDKLDFDAVGHLVPTPPSQPRPPSGPTQSRSINSVSAAAVHNNSTAPLSTQPHKFLLPLASADKPSRNSEPNPPPRPIAYPAPNSPDSMSTIVMTPPKRLQEDSTDLGVAAVTPLSRLPNPPPQAQSHPSRPPASAPTPSPGPATVAAPRPKSSTSLGHSGNVTSTTTAAPNAGPSALPAGERRGSGSSRGRTPPPMLNGGFNGLNGLEESGLRQAAGEMTSPHANCNPSSKAGPASRVVLSPLPQASAESALQGSAAREAPSSHPRPASSKKPLKTVEDSQTPPVGGVS